MLNGNGVPGISWTYDEGKYFDMWMVVHFLTGTVIGLGTYLLGFNPVLAYTGTFVGLAIYELVEEFFDIEETLENRLTDIVFGYAGFALFYPLISPMFSTFGNQMLLVAAGALVIIGAVLGWRAYDKRDNK